MGKSDESFFEKVEGEVLREAGNYFKDKVKRKILKIGEISILVLLAMFLISFGLAHLIGYYIHFLGNGLSYIVLGLVFLLIGYLLGM